MARHNQRLLGGHLWVEPKSIVVSIQIVLHFWTNRNGPIWAEKKSCHLPKAFWRSSITWVGLKCVVSIITLWQLDMACWKISKILVDVPIDMSISNGFPAMFDDREATTVCTGVDEGHLKEMVPYHQLL